jgi:hypothetical protein
MELWGFVILGIFALGVLISIGNDVRSISSRLQDSSINHLPDLPEKIAKAIIWELDMKSELPKNISHELVMGDFSERIAASIGSNLIYDSDLPERIAKSIGSNLIYDSDLPEKIAKSISHEMLMESNLETKISRAIQSQIGYWDIGTDRPSNLMEHLQSIEKKL